LAVDKTKYKECGNSILDFPGRVIAEIGAHVVEDSDATEIVRENDPRAKQQGTIIKNSEQACRTPYSRSKWTIFWPEE
jgi:hypothetical protein